jgi:outer membrane protein assembly factor BamB
VGNLLFVGSCSGNFYALDRQTGGIRWSYNIKKDGNQTSFHGDPLVTDNLILIGADNGTQGHLYAFERESGKVRWKSLAPTRAEGNVGVASDIVRQGNRVYAVAQGHELLCLSLEDGSTRWTFASHFDRQRNLISNSPTLVANLVLLGGLDGLVYALQADSGQVVWKTDLHSRITTTPIVSQESVYVGTQDGHFYQLQAKSGAITRSLVITGFPDRHMTGTADSLLAVLIHPPQTAGGSQFQPNDLDSIGLDLRRVNWLQKSSPTVVRNSWTSSRPYLWKDYVFVGDLGGKLFAFHKSDGSAAWSHQFASRVVRGIGFANDMFYVGMQGGMIYAVAPPF